MCVNSPNFCYEVFIMFCGVCECCVEGSSDQKVEDWNINEGSFYLVIFPDHM